MDSNQFSNYWYGYGYWNEYGASSEDAFESTSYHIFQQPQDKEFHGETNEFPFSTKLEKENSEVHSVLKFLDNLYLESHDLFKKVFSEVEKKYKLKKLNREEKEDGSGQGLSKNEKKVPRKMHKKKMDELKIQTMRRSLSLGSPRTPPSSDQQDSNLRLQRFKVKTLELKGGGGGGGGVRNDGQGT